MNLQPIRNEYIGVKCDQLHTTHNYIYDNIQVCDMILVHVGKFVSVKFTFVVNISLIHW
jgi:hypothetical protein